MVKERSKFLPISYNQFSITTYSMIIVIFQVSISPFPLHSFPISLTSKYAGNVYKFHFKNEFLRPALKFPSQLTKILYEQNACIFIKIVDFIIQTD